jgi:hypothetical protein
LAKRLFDIDLALSRIGDAVRPLPKAALFELADEGFRSPFEQLVACIISIRTYDEVTLPTARRLFALARTPAELSRLTTAQIDFWDRSKSEGSALHWRVMTILNGGGSGRDEVSRLKASRKNKAHFFRQPPRSPPAPVPWAAAGSGGSGRWDPRSASALIRAGRKDAESAGPARGTTAHGPGTGCDVGLQMGRRGQRRAGGRRCSRAESGPCSLQMSYWNPFGSFG